MTAMRCRESKSGRRVAASFEVQLANSGRVVVVPKDTTVTQALLDAGVEAQTSCEQDVCCTCLTRVLTTATNTVPPKRKR